MATAAAAVTRLASRSLLKSRQLECLRVPILYKGVAFHTSGIVQGVTEDFELAKEKLSALQDDPGNQTKLKIYALFKQSTAGVCQGDRPGMLNMVGRAKYDAWSALGSMTEDEAKQAYIDLVDGLVAEDQESSASADSSSAYKTLDVRKEGGVCTIMLNRPKKKNAITEQMYREWIVALGEADSDEKVVVTVMTGSGDYYCSGNDLNNFTGIDPSNIAQHAKDSGVLLREFVDAFINFSKPLIGLVNGPAVGVSVTTMGLFDAVYASDKATFHTPFTSLGQSPEGCSSYLFPKIMGPAKANELLLFNKKITAQQACDWGLITAVIPDGQFQSTTTEMVKGYAKLPKQSLRYSKALTRDLDKETLLKVNQVESDRLVERWQSQECFDAIASFFSRR